ACGAHSGTAIVLPRDESGARGAARRRAAGGVTMHTTAFPWCLLVFTIWHSASGIDARPSASGAAAAEDWPSWRGPSRNGLSTEKNLPLKWTPTENIAWKLAMPSFSGSTPVIWGNRIFLNVAHALPSTQRITLHLS